MVRGPETYEAPVDAGGDGEEVHAGPEAGAYVAPALPFAPGPLLTPLYADRVGGVAAVPSGGALVLKRARPGVHQAAEPVVLHHPTGHRVAQEAPQVLGGPAALVVSDLATHLVKGAEPLLDPLVRPSRRQVGGVAPLISAKPSAKPLEAAVVDAVPALARVR